jgi:pimeloyl-ACP methyl ester carboxylesterase
VTAQPREGFVDGDGVRLHYVEWGDRERPPIRFLHGGSAHAPWWDFVVEQLCDRFRCLARPFRRYGDSPGRRRSTTGWRPMPPTSPL